MQINGIVFDFNGTLFFDTEYHVEAWNRMSMELTNTPVTRHRLETEFAGMPNIEILRTMTGNTLTAEQLEYYSQKKEEMYRNAVASAPGGAHLAPGTEAFFDSLKQKGIPFTIASASIVENIRFFVEIFKLDRWINPDDIVYDNGTYKNKIQMFKDAAQRIHVTDHLLVFEDSLSGIRSADAAGAKVIVIHSEQLRPYYKDYPSIIASISDFTDIEAVLSSVE